MSAGRVAAVLPSPLVDVRARGRGIAERLKRATSGRPAERPALTVIVPFYNVESYLAECLDSIISQSFEDFEVLLVDDGSPDGSRRIAEDYAAQDPRLRLVVQENKGLGAARNHGVREARGHYLTFVDSDDVIPPNAFRKLMVSARESGSDIVVGSVDRFNGARRWQPSWVADVHTRSRIGITIGEHTPLLRNLYTWDKVFRHDFGRPRTSGFGKGSPTNHQPIITQLLARAASIDVIPDVVYLYRSRDDNSSISQQTATLADLLSRIQAWEVSRDTLRDEVSTDLFDAWLGTLFTTHFHWYLTSKGTVDDTYWSEFVRAVRDFSDTAPQSVWDQTRRAANGCSSNSPGRVAEPMRRSLFGRMPRTKGSGPVPFRRGGSAAPTFFGDPQLEDSLFLFAPEHLKLVIRSGRSRRS